MTTPAAASSSESERKDEKKATTIESPPPDNEEVAPAESIPKQRRQVAHHEEPAEDEEGLLLRYDVIICGTGLVQSILASALTRAGKTVLHCDGNDHYGELDTVWTFDHLQELFKRSQTKNDEEKKEKKEKVENRDDDEQDDDTRRIIPLATNGSNQSLRFHSLNTKTKTNFPLTQIGTKVKTSYGEGTVTAKTLPTTTTQEGKLEITLSNWILANDKSPTVSIGVTLQQLDFTDDKSSLEQAMEDYFQSSSEVQSIRAIEAKQILQKQSRQLALDVTPSLLYASGVGVQGMLTSNVAEHLEFQTLQGMYWLDKTNSAGALQRVPCSKGDVMQSTLLPPLDKRRFMKFLQSAMDYATERELQSSLAGPEDPDTTNNTASEDKNNDTEEGVLSLNERQLNQGRSLARPQNKAMAKKDLQTLYDCMEQNLNFDTYLEEHAKLSPQLRQLIRYALALEIKSGATTSGDENTAICLSTKEGMGRLCDHLKALGRFGTTAFLTPLYGSGELSQFFCRSAAVYGATYLLRRNPKNVTVSAEGNKVDGVTMGASDDNDGSFGPPVAEKHIKASHVVLAQDAKEDATFQRRLLRRISFLRGSLIPGGESRSVLIIPPNNHHNRVIHGLLLDETAKVAPNGCSILHLTTVVDYNDDNQDDDVLEKAAQTILKSAPEEVDEIFHATFSYGLLPDVKEDTPQGLHIVHRDPMPLVVDEAFEQARKLFEKICGPQVEFLALSQQMETKLREQLQGAYRDPNQVEDDTEQVVLDSAMEMLQEETKEEETKEEIKA